MVLALHVANQRSLEKRLPKDGLFPLLKLSVGSLDVSVQLSPYPNLTDILGLQVLLTRLLIQFKNTFSQCSFVSIVWLSGRSIFAVSEVAHTLDKNPTTAISVAKRSPSPPFAIGKVVVNVHFVALKY